MTELNRFLNKIERPITKLRGIAGLMSSRNCDGALNLEYYEADGVAMIINNSIDEIRQAEDELRKNTEKPGTGKGEGGDHER